MSQPSIQPGNQFGLTTYCSVEINTEEMGHVTTTTPTKLVSNPKTQPPYGPMKPKCICSIDLFAVKILKLLLQMAWISFSRAYTRVDLPMNGADGQ